MSASPAARRARETPLRNNVPRGATEIIHLFYGSPQIGTGI
jgi:hypothetical protein